MRRSGRSSAVGAVLAAVLTVTVVALAVGASATAGAHARRRNGARVSAAGPRFPGTDCTAFPADNVWNTPITTLPVDSHSQKWLADMAAVSTYLHPDYGPGGGSSPYGIPWQITSPRPVFVKLHFDYAGQSDPGPYPFSARTPVEGGANATGDRHALMVDPSTCVLYEL